MSFKFWKKHKKPVAAEGAGTRVMAVTDDKGKMKAETTAKDAWAAMTEEEKVRQRRHNMMYLSASKVVQEQLEGNRGSDLLSSHWDAVNRESRYFGNTINSELITPLPPIEQLPVSEIDKSMIPLQDDEDIDLQMYRYEPLPTETSIRVLQLLSSPESGDSDYEIVCQILTVDLNEKPDYAALSYTWGLPQLLYHVAIEKSDLTHEFEMCYPVSCNGVTLMVARNLFQALQTLRADSIASTIEQQTKTPTPQFLWIDAICINQEDTAERNAQVEMMGSIYQSARLVIVWLGPHKWYSSPAMQCFNAIIAIAQKYGATNLSHVDITQSEWWKGQEVDMYLEQQSGRPYWEALYVYLQHTWFRRSWIVQEISFARQAVMLCGHAIINWDVFAKCCTFLTYQTWNVQMERVGRVFIDGTSKSDMMTRIASPGVMAPEIFNSLHYFVKGERINLPFPAIHTVKALRGSLQRANRAANQTHPGILREILDLCRSFEATDDKDKLYAFMSVAEAMLELPRDPSDRPIRVNYRKATQQIFIETTQYILSSMEPLRSITDLMGRNTEYLWQLEDKIFSRITNLPSWVPDLSTPCLPVPFGDEVAREWNVWPLDLRLATPPSIDGDLIYSRGILLDVIEEVARIDGDFLANAVQVVKGLPTIYRGPQQFEPLEDAELRVKQVMEELTSDEFQLAMVTSRRVASALRSVALSKPAIGAGEDDNLDDPEVATLKGQIEGKVSHHASPRPQSKTEALWRTLLLDFSRQVPARLTAGFAFGDWIVRGIEEAYMAWIIRPNAGTVRELETAVRILCELDASEPPIDIAGVLWPATRAEDIEELRAYTKADYFAGMFTSMLNISQRSDLTNDESTWEAAKIFWQEAESLAPIRFVPTWDQARGYMLRSVLSDSTRDRIARRQVSFFEQYNKYNPGRRVFRTRDGWLGNGHQSARPGDQIWYLPLCTTLFILRPVNSSGAPLRQMNEVQQRFTMVGACYVHGLMHREGGFERNNDVIKEIVIE